MYDELVNRLRSEAECPDNYPEDSCLMREAADAIEELSKPRWISVTGRLPELNVACLVYNKYYGPMVGTRIDDMRFRIPGSYFPDTPTHWMQLSKPPKEETE